MHKQKYRFVIKRRKTEQRYEFNGPYLIQGVVIHAFFRLGFLLPDKENVKQTLSKRFSVSVKDVSRWHCLLWETKFE